MIFLDTNAIIYLYAGDRHFSERTQKFMDDNDCLISPVVQLEYQYLHEIGRVKKTFETVLNALKQDIDLEMSDISLSKLINEAVKITWTRDPFDRLITAHAKLEHRYLITSDQTIQKHYSKALW